MCYYFYMDKEKIIRRRETQRLYRLRNPEKMKEKGRKYREKNKDRIRKYYRRWYKKNGRNRSDDYIDIIRDWQKKNPKAMVARIEVRKMLTRGELKKPDNCERCGVEAKLSGH